MQNSNRASVEAFGGSLPPLGLAKTGNLSYFRLTFLCAGKEYHITQRARNAQAAQAEGLLELSYQFGEFDFKDARLTASVQES